MDVKNGYKPLVNLENHKCFGCSPTNPAGLFALFSPSGLKKKTVVNQAGIDDLARLIGG